MAQTVLRGVKIGKQAPLKDTCAQCELLEVQISTATPIAKATLRKAKVTARYDRNTYHNKFAKESWGDTPISMYSTPGVQHPDRAEHVVIDYAKGLNMCKMPVKDKWYCSELKADRLVVLLGWIQC